MLHQKKCPDCGYQDCKCSQNVSQKVILNINFATGGTGSSGAEFPGVTVEFNLAKLQDGNYDVDFRSGSKNNYRN